MPWVCRIGGTLALLAFSSGCTTIRASAIPTGPTTYAPGNGDVAVYASGIIPGNLQQIGEVRVTGAGSDARIDALFPEFLRKASSLGATAVSLDLIDTGFQNIPATGWTSYSYYCGYGRTMCWGQRPYTYISQVAQMTLVGRALRGPVAPTGGAQ